MLALFFVSVIFFPSLLLSFLFWCNTNLNMRKHHSLCFVLCALLLRFIRQVLFLPFEKAELSRPVQNRILFLLFSPRWLLPGGRRSRRCCASACPFNQVDVEIKINVLMNQCAITLKTILCRYQSTSIAKRGVIRLKASLRNHERAIWFVDRMKQVHFFNGNKSMISSVTSAAELLWRRCQTKSKSVNVAILHSTN